MEVRHPVIAVSSTLTHRLTQHLRQRLYLLLLILAGVVFRILIAFSPRGAFNSDEAITGLTSLSVLRGEFPLIVPGNDYGGVLEAYVMAPFVLLLRIFGYETHGARLLDGLNITLHVGLFVLVYFAIKQVSSRSMAMFAILPMWLLSDAYIRLASESYLGYVAGPAAGIGSVLLAVRHEQTATSAPDSKRLLLGSSFLAGVAFWQHPLAAILPLCTLAGLGVSELIRKGDRIAVIRRYSIAVFAVALGALPEIIRLVQRRNDLRLATSPTPRPFTTRFTYIFTQHLPRGLGLRMESGEWLAPTLQVWVPAVLAMVIIVAIAVVLRSGPRCLAAMPLGLVAFAGTSTTSYVNDGRYSLFITPLLATLAAAALHQLTRQAVGRRLGNSSIQSTVRAPTVIAPRVQVAMAAVAVLGVLAGSWRSMGSSVTDLRWQSEPDVLSIVKLLDAKGITNVRGEYWIVYRIGHITSERIATSDFTIKRIDRLEKRVAASPPQQLAWISLDANTQPAEVVDNLDWPSTVIGPYRLYTYNPPAP